MNLWNKIKGFFNRKERRQHEKEVRGQSRKWWQFWKRKEEPEAPEVEEAAPWRVDSQSLMDEAEKFARKKEEEEAKKADEQEKRDQYEKARDTANKRYGTNFTQEEYDRIWDFYGNNPDIAEFFPSEDIIYAGEFAKQNHIPFSRFIDILKEVAASAQGQGWNRQEASQRLWQVLDLEAAKVKAYEAGVFEEEYEEVY